MSSGRSTESTQSMDEMWGEAAASSGDAVHGAWFQHDKYSLFVHWGLNSLLGGEWQGRNYYGIGEWIMHPKMAGIPVVEYRKLADRFDPQAFDAQAIVDLAKAAGMRCIVFTAKHHEGFAMYDSAVSDFTITKASPLGRDVLGELAAACHAAGIRFGFYYSQFQDWIEPDGGGTKCELPPDFEPDFDRYFDGKVIPQVTELLQNYGPVSVVWFDTPGGMSASHSQRLIDLVHDLQPGCLINSRVGNGLGDYSTLGDMELPTRTPGPGLYECIDTTNDSWAYSRHDSNWKSPSQLVRSLLRVIARRCSFMLNIGPDGEGRVPEPALSAIDGAGVWVRRYQEAVYGTTASPFPPMSWGDCTVKGTDLFVHVFDWPRSGQLRLAGLGTTVCAVSVLPTEATVRYRQDADLVTIDLSQVDPDPIVTVLRLRCEESPQALYQDLQVDGEHPTHLPAEYATCSGVSLHPHRWMETFGEWKKAEQLEQWFAAADAQASWQVNLLTPGRYIVSIDYACTQESEGSEWEISNGSETVRFYALPSGQISGERRMRYRCVDCGVITFASGGRQHMTMQPLTGTKPGDIGLRALRLRPWL